MPSSRRLRTLQPGRFSIRYGSRVHGRNELAGNTAADHFVDELDAGAGFAGFEYHFDFGELARAAGLFFVGIDVFDRLAERFAVADPGLTHGGFDAEFGTHAVDRDLEVVLPHAAQYRLAGFVVDVQAQRRIRFYHLVQRR